MGGTSDDGYASAARRRTRGRGRRRRRVRRPTGLLADAIPAATVPIPPTSRRRPRSVPRPPGSGSLQGDPGSAAEEDRAAAAQGGASAEGIGPGTEFFGAKDRASSFAYVIDCSGSMSNRGALRIAKAELINSLDRIPPDAKFTVVFYSVKARRFVP